MNSTIRAMQMTITALLQEEVSILQQAGAPRAQIEDLTSIYFVSDCINKLLLCYNNIDGHYHENSGSLIDKEIALFALGRIKDKTA